jgi:hypothetical protein
MNKMGEEPIKKRTEKQIKEDRLIEKIKKDRIKRNIQKHAMYE